MQLIILGMAASTWLSHILSNINFLFSEWRIAAISAIVIDERLMHSLNLKFRR